MNSIKVYQRQLSAAEQAHNARRAQWYSKRMQQQEGKVYTADKNGYLFESYREKGDRWR